jgi:hypothetical protein
MFRILILTPLRLPLTNLICPSPLLHVKYNTIRKVLTRFLQEIKQDIVFQHAQLTALHRHEELLARIQAHLLSLVNKIRALLEYQGVLHYLYALALLGCLSIPLTS